MILNQGKVAGGLVDELLEVVHVYPLNDLRDHIVEGRDCWCHPEYDEEHNVLIHNSLDGREKYETGELKEH